MMNKNNALNLLGLIYRAKKLSIGSDDTINKIKEKKVFLVLLDKNTSSNVEKQLIKICDLNGIPLIREFDSEELSHSIGLKGIKVLGLTDEGFAKSILKSL